MKAFNSSIPLQGNKKQYHYQFSVIKNDERSSIVEENNTVSGSILKFMCL